MKSPHGSLVRASLLVGGIIAGSASTFAAAPLAPTGLMTELLEYPERTYISNRTPAFSWIVNDADKDEMQTGYQILVASTLANINADNGDLWNSGKVTSSMSINVPYGGSSLASRGDCFWKVKTWDKDGIASPYSSYQKFSFNPPAASLYSKVPKVNCYLPDTQLVAPSRLVQIGTGHYFIEFPKDAYGTIALTFNATSSGTLTVRLGEAKSGDAVNTDPGYQIYYEQNSLSYSAGNQTYQYQTHFPGTLSIPADWATNNRPDLLFVTVPFRYVEILNCPVALTQSQIRQVAVFYPRDTSAAQFTCNNSILNSVWEFCKYTQFATSWLGVMVDGNRERLPYEADGFINQLGYYCVGREYSYARTTIDTLLQNPTDPAEWPPQMILMAWAQYLNTGDKSDLVKNYAKLQGKLMSKDATGNGLVDVSNYRSIQDWPEPNNDSYDWKGVNAVTNSLHYRTLICMRDIAHALGKSADSSTYDAAAKTVYTAYNTTFFNATQGLYIDGVGSAHASAQANFWALVGYLVPSDKVAKVVQFLKTRKTQFGTYGAQHLFDGLCAYGEGAYVLDFMSGTQSPQSWYHMMQLGCTITPETWDPSLSDGEGGPQWYDWNHAWSSAPVNIIPRWIMGIQPVEPGFGKISIKPQVGSLTSASIDLPTIRGTVHVDVTQSQSTYTLVTSIPANTIASVYFPKRAGATAVFKDGVQTQGVDDGNHWRFDNTGSGTHIFSTQSTTAINNLHPSNPMVTKISINGNVFSVKLDGAAKEATVSLFNTQGRQVCRWERVSLLNAISLRNRLLADGRYIVKVASGGYVMTKQVRIIKR